MTLTRKFRRRDGSEHRPDPDPDCASSQAASQLPVEVNNYGVTVQKSTSAPLMLVALYSPNETYDEIFLANYAYINLNDQLTRVPGIANVQVFGAGQYAMRLWVKPDQLAKLGITVPEIISAIQSTEHREPGRARSAASRCRKGRSTPTPCARRADCNRRRNSARS